MSPKKLKPPIPTEHEEQVLFFDWARMMAIGEPSRFGVLNWMFAVPNGSLRNPKVAVKLKREGVKPGVPDIMLPATVRYEYFGTHTMYHGLFIEMKRRDKSLSRTSKIQKAYHEFLRTQGYLVVVAYGADEAKAVVLDYLEVKR